MSLVGVPRTETARCISTQIQPPHAEQEDGRAYVPVACTLIRAQTRVARALGRRVPLENTALVGKGPRYWRRAQNVRVECTPHQQGPSHARGLRAMRDDTGSKAVPLPRKPCANTANQGDTRPPEA